MIVMKFGGSSVANADRIRHVASIIKAYKEKRRLSLLQFSYYEQRRHRQKLHLQTLLSDPLPSDVF